jgi:hypothetical protein
MKLNALGALTCALLLAVPYVGHAGTEVPTGSADVSRSNQAVSLRSQGDGAELGANGNPLVVGQGYVDLTSTPTITSGSAYASGNAVGGLITLSNVVAKTGQGGRIESVTLYSKSAQTGEIDFVWCGQQNPTGSTITDKTAVSIAAADFNKCRTVAQLTNWQSFGAVSVAASGQLAEPFVITSGTTGYGFLIARSTPTFSSTSDLQLTVRIGH